PEDTVIYRSYVESICDRLSGNARTLFLILLQEDWTFQELSSLEVLANQNTGSTKSVKMDLARIASYLGWTRVEVKGYWFEILWALPKSLLQEGSLRQRENKVVRVNLI